MSQLNSAQLTQKWTSLAERERRLLIGLAIFLVLVSLYSLIWAPIQNDHQLKQAGLNKAKADWFWLAEQAPKVSQQPLKKQSLKIGSKTELMDVLQKSLSQQKLLKSAQGLNLSNRGVTVSFNQVDAPRLFRWLGQLEGRGLKAFKMDLTPISAGLTQATIEFEAAR